MSSKHRSVVSKIPDEVIFKKHDNSAPCLRCAVILAINEFADEHGGDIDPDVVIDDVGDILAQWIAGLDDARYRDYTANVAGEILRRRVKRYRETGKYPGANQVLH